MLLIFSEAIAWNIIHAKPFPNCLWMIIPVFNKISCENKIEILVIQYQLIFLIYLNSESSPAAGRQLKISCDFFYPTLPSWEILHPQLFSSYGIGCTGLREALPSTGKDLNYMCHASHIQCPIEKYSSYKGLYVCLCSQNKILFPGMSRLKAICML